MGTIIKNKKVEHLYFIVERFEAGIVLKGTEVKSLRAHNANFNDSFAKIENGEVFLHNLYIKPYESGTFFNHDPMRKRKLLLHKREIRRLMGKIKEKGYTMVPTELYFNENDKVKVEIALCRGKKKFDKRSDLVAKEQKREILKKLKYDK